MSALRESSVLNDLELSRPISFSLEASSIFGRLGKRLMVILRSPGCNYYQRRQGGCSYCGFSLLTEPRRRCTPDEYASQLRYALEASCAHDVDRLEIDLYNSGNFLNDSELAPMARSALAQVYASVPNLALLSVDSRPEFINTPHLRTWLTSHPRSFAPELIEIGIGLEVFDDDLRVTELRKNFSRQDFASAVKRLSKTGVGLLTYVMLKPSLMSDERALSEVVGAAEFAVETAARYRVRGRIALEPTFVVRGTTLEGQAMKGLYSPPTSDLVVEAVTRLHHSVGAVRVGLWHEGLDSLRDPIETTTLQKYNLHQDLSVFTSF